MPTHPPFTVSQPAQRVAQAILNGELLPFYHKPGMIVERSPGRIIRWRPGAFGQLEGDVSYFRSRHYCAYCFTIRFSDSPAGTVVNIGASLKWWGMILSVLAWVICIAICIGIPFLILGLILEKKGFNRFFSDIERALRHWDASAQVPQLGVRNSPPQLPSTAPAVAPGTGIQQEPATGVTRYFVYFLPTETDSKAPPPMPRPLRPGTAIVGRSEESDFPIQNPLVSGRHARIEFSEPFTVEVEDLGSSNGTYLNGSPVSRAQISDGDLLAFANAEYLVQIREVVS